MAAVEQELGNSMARCEFTSSIQLQPLYPRPRIEIERFDIPVIRLRIARSFLD